MTRAILVLLEDERLISTTEFNGDGYLEGYGKEYLAILEESKDTMVFESLVTDFRNKYFKHYEEDLFYPEKRKEFYKANDVNIVSMSDYEYWKNNSTTNQRIVDREGELIILKPKEIVVFYFGRLYLKTFEREV